MKPNKFYIDGKWTVPSKDEAMAVVNPANLEVCALMA